MRAVQNLHGGDVPLEAFHRNTPDIPSRTPRTKAMAVLLCGLTLLGSCSQAPLGEADARPAAQASPPAVPAQSLQTGVVRSVQPVPVASRMDHGTAGGIAGGLLGAIGGAAIGGGVGAALASLAGSVAGSVAGSAAGQGAVTRPGQEIVVDLDGGGVRTVVQEDSNGSFAVGERVRVVSDGSGVHVLRADASPPAQ